MPPDGRRGVVLMRHGLVLLVVAVLLITVPAGLLVWLRTASQDRLSSLEPSPDPLVLSVESREVTDTVQVTIEAVWGETPELVAPSWFGTVTDVPVAPGDTLTSGDTVVRIDGIDRVAVRSAEPFWRPLHYGDRGEDVVMLQRWLSTRESYAGKTDGVFDQDLATAVSRWAESLGVDRPDGSFDPGWVVWLPAVRFPVTEVAVTVGSLAPGAGSVIVKGNVPLRSVSFSDQDGRSPAEAGRWVLTVGEVEVGVDGGVVDSDGLETLGAVLDPAEPAASARLRSVEPAAVLEVPATAIVSNLDGALCVFVPEGDGFTARTVTLGGGQIGRVRVATGLSPGDEVLVNPADVFKVPACS